MTWQWFGCKLMMYPAENTESMGKEEKMMEMLGSLIALAIFGILLFLCGEVVKDFLRYISRNSDRNTRNYGHKVNRKFHQPNGYHPGWKWNEAEKRWEPPSQKEKHTSKEDQAPNNEEKPKGAEEIDFSKTYQARYIFTKNEYHNFKKLRDIAEVKGYVVLPKIRLSDIIEPRRGEEKFRTLLNKVQSKHVDFVICDKDMYIKAIIELDDSSHDTPDRIERDEFVDLILKSVGYKVIHTRYINYDILDLI